MRLRVRLRASRRDARQLSTRRASARPRDSHTAFFTPRPVVGPEFAPQRMENIMVFWQPPLPPPPPAPPAFAVSDLATHPFFLTLACMLVLDVAVCRHTSARWFLLHAWGNIIVTVFALPDALLAADNPGTSCIGGASTYVPLWQIIILHVYHLVFFACSTADWVHHCVFVSIIGGCGLYFEGGPLVNLVAFFVSRATSRRPARPRLSACNWRGSDVRTARRPRLRDALAREARPSRSAR